MPILVFVRHGQTDWNADGRFQGQQDVPLNDLGRSQARRNGFAIHDHMPEAAGYDFVASPLIRTRETMELVRGAMGLDPKAYRLDPTLKELTFGEWEGFTAAQLVEQYPERMREREADKWGFVPPGGESYGMLEKRVQGWLDTLTVDTVAVAHGGVSRVLRAILLGIEPVEAASLDVPQDKVFVWDGKSAGWF